ncbi:MAG: hypothetical protein JW384_01029 [Nitrosomonadaceae bacterium]|nr:hypothetical protein [Nitrosomonadaceae bacterium]
MPRVRFADGWPRDKSQGLRAPSVQVPSVTTRGEERSSPGGRAPPTGAQADPAGIGVAVHDHHAPPLRVAVLGDVDFVTGAVVSAVLVVVDGVHPLREQPREHQAFVREGLGIAHRRDVLPLAVGREVVDDDPLDDRVVRLVAVEEPEALHVLAAVRHRLGVQQLPAPVLGVGALHRFPVTLEGEVHALRALAPTDAEATERVLALGPDGGGIGEPGEHVFGDTPVAGLVLSAKGGELLVHRLLEGVGVGLLVRGLHHELHQLVVAEELEEEGHGAAEAEETAEELIGLTEKHVHHAPRSHL